MPTDYNALYNEIMEQAHIRLYRQNSDYQYDREHDYCEPWISYTDDVEEVHYNKTEEETNNQNG